MSDFRRLSEEIINSFDDVVSEICRQLSRFSRDVIMNDDSEECIQCNSVLLDLGNFIKNHYDHFRLNYAQAYMLFSSQNLLQKLEPFSGLYIFFVNLLEALLDPENIKATYKLYSKMKNYSISELCTQVFFSNDEDDIQSLYLFIIKSELLNIKSSESKWFYWVRPATSADPLPKLWREHFLKILLCPEISKLFMKMFKMEKIVYEASVCTALSRTRQVILPESLYGFTTQNLYIFIRNTFGNNNLLNKAGAFFTVFHELSHYLWRSRCENLGESLAIHTPIGELGLSEGGIIAETLLFGGHVGFISQSGAEYLFKDTESFDSETLKTFLIIGEIRNLPSEPGVILKRSRFLKRSCII